jgi:hypothetical protein
MVGVSVGYAELQNALAFVKPKRTSETAAEEAFGEVRTSKAEPPSGEPESFVSTINRACAAMFSATGH